MALGQTRSSSTFATADAIELAYRVADCYSVEGELLPGANVLGDPLTWMSSNPQRSKGRRFLGSSLGGRMELVEPVFLCYQALKYYHSWEFVIKPHFRQSAVF